MMMDKIKRFSWTESFRDEENNISFKEEYLFLLDDILYELWSLGCNIILAWTPSNKGIEVLVVPHYSIGEAITKDWPDSVERKISNDNREIVEFLQKIVAGPKMVSHETLLHVSNLLHCEPQHVELPYIPGKDLPLNTISALIKRYSLTYVEDRAVALFDAVGFSHYSPLEQATQLNSLSYSVNTAFSKLMVRGIKIRFARTTTGDGFYIWNRNRSLNANVDLYHFMHLVLADNAIARSKARSSIVPLLRTSFHVGGHYEFYQSEGLSPTTFSYIVGDVTIELARMIDKAKPGQILVGGFQTPMLDKDTGKTVRISAVDFINKAQNRLSSLSDLILGGDPIDSIKCYLTGSKRAEDKFGINRYFLKDKHGYTRYVFNAKVNIHRKNSNPIYLGVQDKELTDFGIAEEWI
ncbi:MAG: hypothetical protein JRF32_12000 [Deltaproteobacteria bacterium]|nr:hypothetical protein [Deltaproteobacteria bacterium]